MFERTDDHFRQIKLQNYRTLGHLGVVGNPKILKINPKS
jgi:hypothetical protein